MKRLLIIFLLCTTLSACGFFDKDNTPPPTALKKFKPEAQLRLKWYTSATSGAGKDYIRLVPAVTDTAIYTASHEGKISATDKFTGKSLWSTRSHYLITAGPGAGDGIVVTGGRAGNITALNQADGKIIWTAQTSSEILAAPVVKNGLTIVKAIDGKVTAYSNQDGHMIWNYQQVEPNLILRGASAPQVTDRSVLVGFENGNLLKLGLRHGDLIWQKTIAIPQGGFAIERMVDIDADPFVYGNRVYVATYQGQITALDLSSAQTRWTHDISSYTGITADTRQAYITDAKSYVWAFTANNGQVTWQQTDLYARNITGPAILGNNIVVGDAEGYLHVLDKQDGHFVARTKVNSSGMIAAPVVDNNVIYVLTKDGHLAAYTLT